MNINGFFRVTHFWHCAHANRSTRNMNISNNFEYQTNHITAYYRFLSIRCCCYFVFGLMPPNSHEKRDNHFWIEVILYIVSHMSIFARTHPNIRPITISWRSHNTHSYNEIAVSMSSRANLFQFRTLVWNF